MYNLCTRTTTMIHYGTFFPCKGFIFVAIVCNTIMLTQARSLEKDIDECEGLFRCGNGKCIHNRFRCDGKDDCYDNTDEKNCTIACRTDQFACSSGTQCIETTNRCDNITHCDDGSDEQNCPTASDDKSSTIVDPESTANPGRPENYWTAWEIVRIVFEVVIGVSLLVVLCCWLFNRIYCEHGIILDRLILGTRRLYGN